MKKFILITLIAHCYIPVTFAQIENIQQRPKPSQRPDLLTKADTVAGYKGGNQNLFDYLTSNFRVKDSLLPAQSPDYFTFLSFIIDHEGKVSQVKLNEADVSKNIAPEIIQKEILRLTIEMPDWNPGIKEGEAISSLVYLPIYYKIRSGKLIILEQQTGTTVKKKKKLSPEKIVIIASFVILIAGVAFFGLLK